MHDASAPGSAWADAVRMGQLRDGAAAVGEASFVRALARADNTSSGRVGDLLKIVKHSVMRTSTASAPFPARM